MSFICDKEVLFVGEDSRDTSLLVTVHIHDLIGLYKKNCGFARSKTTGRGRMG
jgi:hypothetical protein